MTASVNTEQEQASEEPGDRGPVTQRARFKVNKPAPKAVSFGTGEPAFVKAEGRSPGAPPRLAESAGRRSVGALPAPDARRLPELSRRPSRLAVLARRLRRARPIEWALLASVLIAVAFLVIVARHR